MYTEKLLKQNYPEFEKKDYKSAFLDIFKETSNWDNDEINTKVWWILTTEQKNEIEESFNQKTKYTRKSVKNDILDIIKLRDSLNWKKNLYITQIDTLIKKQCKNPSLWFEFFILDYLKRELEFSNDISFEKPWYHIDQNYSTDLVCNINDSNWSTKNIWIDLTFARQEHIVDKKYNKINTVNEKLSEWLNSYSKKRAPFKTSLLVINPQAMKRPHNCYTDALNKFYNSDNKAWWPSKFLDKKLNNRMKNFSKILISIFEKLNNNNLENYEIEWNNIEIKKEANKIRFIASRDNKLLFKYDLPI
jgi:hypothetical protein